MRSARAYILPALMLIYGAASLLHHTHNAVFIRDYPNLPAWITPAGVWIAWSATAALGVLGYWLYRRGARKAGLVIIAVYAVLGLAGLDHYTLAPMSAHTLVMNLTILIEVATAALLLAFIARSARYSK